MLNRCSARQQESNPRLTPKATARLRRTVALGHWLLGDAFPDMPLTELD
jgi:hypothetical protein